MSLIPLVSFYSKCLLESLILSIACSVCMLGTMGAIEIVDQSIPYILLYPIVTYSKCKQFLIKTK